MDKDELSDAEAALEIAISSGHSDHSPIASVSLGNIFQREATRPGPQRFISQ
jgi:hypothetical protein